MTIAALPEQVCRFRCLGAAQLADPAGRVLPIRTRKQVALLCFLARRTGRPVARDELIDLLWSSSDEKASRHSLSQSISLINKNLAREAIVHAGRNRLVLEAGSLWLDVNEFETLASSGHHEAAMKLWRGTLLEGLWVQQAPNFERWLNEERGRLQRTFRRLAHARLGELRTAGDYLGMREESERLLQQDSLDEQAMLAHLESLSLTGDRALALRRFADFEGTLKQELAAEPGTRLKSWARRNRRSDELHSQLLVPRVGETTVLPTQVPLFGRTDEFSKLWRAWENTQQGTGTVIVLEGVPGIGKSALLTKLASQVHVSGGSTCLTRCYRTEKSVPFAPITAIIRQLSRLPGFVATDPVWIGELTRLVPELRVRYPSAPLPMAVDDAARHRLSDAVVHACNTVSDEQPVLIAIDDIQESDEPTLAVLHYLARQLSTVPIAILVALRSSEAPTGLQKSFLDGVRRLEWSLGLLLDSLPKAEMERLIRHTLATRGRQTDPQVLETILGRASGNPLRAIEAAVAVSEQENKGLGSTEPGEAFDESALHRLTGLGPAALVVANCAVVAGRPLTQYELSVVSQLPLAELSQAIGILETQNFFRRSGDAFVLSHDLYARTIEAGASAATKSKLHCRFAELISKSASDNPSAHFEVARHYVAGEQPKLAKDQALEAARHAKSLGATRERASALELAMSVSCQFDPPVAISLVQCLLQLREHQKVQAVCEHAETAQMAADERACFRYASIASGHLMGALSTSDARTGLEQLLEGTSGFELAAAARTLLMRVSTRLADHDLMRRTSKALRRSFPRGTQEWASHSYLAVGYTAAKYYWPHRALPLMQRALAAASEAHDLDAEHLCRTGLCAVNRQLGAFKESIAEAELALALARRTLNPQLQASDLTDMANAEFAMGDYRSSRSHFLEALAILVHHPEPSTEVFTRSNFGEMLLLENYLDEAAEQFEEALATANRLSLIPNAIQCHAGLALRSLAIEDESGIAMHCRSIRQLGGGNERRYHDRWMTEASFAWENAVIHGDVQSAIHDLGDAARELRRRDVDHWLLVECESIRIQRVMLKSVDTEQLESLRLRATLLGAGGVLHRLDDS